MEEPQFFKKIEAQESGTERMREEKEKIAHIQDAAVHGDWQEASRTFATMSGVHTEEGAQSDFVSSQELLAVVEDPARARGSKIPAWLRSILGGIHAWIFPGDSGDGVGVYREKKLAMWPTSIASLGKEAIPQAGFAANDREESPEVPAELLIKSEEEKRKGEYQEKRPTVQ